MKGTDTHIIKKYEFDFASLHEVEKKFIIELQFLQQAGYRLNLDNPKSFNEKIQWIKLYYKDDLMTKCADKVLARDYIKEKIGEKYLINCLGIYNNASEIDFEKLPERFVLKVNWGSGQNIICKNKSQLNISEVKEKLTYWLRPENNHYYKFLEWCYKNIKPKILCEEYIENNGDIVDYKFFCYNGKPKHMFIVQNRSLGHGKMTIDFFDMHYNWLPFKRYYDNASHPPARPEKWNEMQKLAKVLAQPFPFVRVDFYENFGQLKVGELTFYPGNGTEPFYPREWDYILGQNLILPMSTTSKHDAGISIDGRLVEHLVALEGRYRCKGLSRVMPFEGCLLKFAQYLKRFLHAPDIVLVEVGVSSGAGLAIWSELFKNGTVIGLDVDFKKFRSNEQKLHSKGAFKKNNIHLFKFDRINKIDNELQNYLLSRKIDIFIDRRGSSDEEIIRTMVKMKHFMKENFVYIVEHGSRIQLAINHIFKFCNIDYNEGWAFITNL